VEEEESGEVVASHDVVALVVQLLRMQRRGVG
jgi:hypothetical protein